MSNPQICFFLDSTNYQADLTATVLLDQTPVFTKTIIEKNQVIVDIPDDEKEHVLHIVMSGKTAEHTKIDDQGNILEDSCITVTDVTVDQIALGQVFYNTAKYTHNFNNTGTTTTQQFFGIMGCNGTVELRFQTPIYLWLLEHL